MTKCYSIKLINNKSHQIECYKCANQSQKWFNKQKRPN